MGAQFSDFDEFRRLAGDWTLDFCQLDTGPSSGAFMQVADDEIGLMKFELSRAYRQRGETPSGTAVFAVNGDEAVNLTALDAAVGQDLMALIADSALAESVAAKMDGAASVSVASITPALPQHRPALFQNPGVRAGIPLVSNPATSLSANAR